MQTGSLLLFQRDVRIPLAEQGNTAVEDPQVMERMGYSFNTCVHVMEVFAGVLAFFAAGTYLFPYHMDEC